MNVESLTNLKTLVSVLEARGFHESYGDWICDHLMSLDFYDDRNRHIRVCTEYSKEQEDLIEQLPEGTEFQLDYNLVIVTGIEFEGDIMYPAENYDGNRENPIPLLGIYNQHNAHINQNTFPKYFEKAWQIFEDPTTHAVKIQKLHAQHVEKFNNYCKAILEKFDYHCVYDSYWDVKYLRESSNPMFEYKFDRLNNVYFTTDLLTEKFLMDGYEVDFEHFEEVFVNKFMKWSDKIKPEFKYLFSDDPKYTRDSYYEIYRLHRGLHDNIYYDDINWDVIPDCEKELVRQYKEKFNGFMETK